MRCANRDSRLATRDSRTANREQRTANRELRTANRELFFDIIDVLRAEALQKRARPGAVELWIRRLNREKEPVLARVRREPFDVEHGVILHREAVQCEHPEYRVKRGKQECQLEVYRHEHGP